MMGTLPVLQQGSDVQVYLSNEELPDFYMEDFSVLGLLVANLDRAHGVLTGKDYTVHSKSNHLKVNFDGADQMAEIVNLLIQNDIDCEIADIVNQIYQG